MADVLCNNCGEQIFAEEWHRFQAQRIVSAEGDSNVEKCPFCLESDYVDLSENSIKRNSGDGESRSSFYKWLKEGLRDE